MGVRVELATLKVVTCLSVMAPPNLTEADVLQALNRIADPEFGRTIVDLGYVQAVDLRDDQVSVQLVFLYPNSPSCAGVESQVRQLLSGIRGVESVQVETSWQVTSKSVTQASQLIPLVKNAVAVASGKGGVGKSTVAANLATALHSFGASVGLMDADVYGPSIPKLMGASKQPQVTPENRIIPPQARGIKLISMGYFLPKDDAVIWRGPMLHKMIQDFLGLVEWGELDYLVIDLPPGTGDVQLSLCQTIPLTGAVVVSTPQDLALEVAAKAIAMFRKLNTPVLGILENMSYYHCSHCGERDDIFGHGGARQASSELGYPFLGEIPLSSLIRERSDRGDPIALDSASEYGQAYRQFARGVAREVASGNMVEPTEISIEI